MINGNVVFSCSFLNIMQLERSQTGLLVYESYVKDISFDILLIITDLPC